MTRNENDLLIRIDERVTTIFKKLDSIEKTQLEANERHFKCQIEIIPKLTSDIKLLKQRPMGITASIIGFLLKKI